MQEALDTRLVAAAAQSALEGGAGTAAIVSSAAAGKQQHSGQAVAAAALTGTRGPALVPPAGAAAAWRGVLWGRVEAMCEAFQRITLQARERGQAYLKQNTYFPVPSHPRRCGI